MIIIRILFGFAVTVISVFVSVFLGSLLIKGKDNVHWSPSKIAAIWIEGIFVAVFATLYFVKIGVIL